ncbi:unnamed protein product [Calypogeia fissa]
MIVAEASARYDIDANGFYTADAHHFDVCKPKSVNDSTFRHLVELITDVVEDSRTLATARTDFRCEGLSMQAPIQCAMDGQILHSESKTITLYILELPLAAVSCEMDFTNDEVLLIYT